MADQLECLEDQGEGTCAGPVEYRLALSATGKSYPRCERHWEARLKTQEGINERLLMERGFGWHYPPGMPGPRSEALIVECPNCEASIGITETYELGGTFIDPEECPACGESWPDDILSHASAPEPDPDQLRDQEFEARMQDEEDRRDERNENYPEDIPH
jgi:ssDNA-binding Zn-finger/Zn-ribbon topoisomerase 1